MTIPSAWLSDDGDRFDRLRRIDWWEQDRLQAARVLVLGAGALGNEICKHLALVGIGHIFIADMDLIESSNLSRSVLFRESDRGRLKAEVAATAVRNIYPDASVQWQCVDLRFELGLGIYNWADVIIAGMDNREARLWINRCCWQTGKPWIDGATEVLQGIARSFVPTEGPCYACTLSDADWQQLHARQGCFGLRPADTLAGRVPTTSIAASIVAALQVQEAIKLLHGISGLAGKAIVFNGYSNEFYQVKYQRHPDCDLHDGPIRPVECLPFTTTHTTLGDLIARIEALLGPEAKVVFNHEIVVGFNCPVCGFVAGGFKPRAALSEDHAICPQCDRTRRVESVQSADRTASYVNRTLADLGMPPFDIVTGRLGKDEVSLVFDGDATNILGPLAENYRERASDFRINT